MDLTDFTTGTEITIYIQIMDKKISAVCTVIGPRENGIMVTQPRYRNVPLNEMHDFTFSIHDNDNNKYNFKCRLIRPIQKFNNKFYYMEGLDGFDSSDFRKAKRYPVGIHGTAHSGLGDDVKIIIFDISMRGISFVAEEEMDFRLEDEVRLTFQEATESRHLNLTAVIVRKFSVDQYEAAGCRITGMGTDVMAFINKIKDHYENNDLKKKKPYWM